MKISIVVPIYKIEEKKLRRCIESLINQSYRNIEIFLVDDGSPDHCPAICDEYSEVDERIRVIHQQNKGLSGARNAGVLLATGVYLTFVDGDDFIDLDGIARMAEVACENMPDILCTRLNAASRAEDIGRYPYTDKKIYRTDEEKYYLLTMLLNFNGNNNCSCGKFYKKTFLHTYALMHDSDLKQGAEDLEFNVRAFKVADTIQIVKNSFYNCVYNSNSITRSYNEYNIYLALKCFDKIKDHIDPNDLELMEWFYNRLLYVMINAIISGYFNPSNMLSYKIKKMKIENYISHPLLVDAQRYGIHKPLDIKRKIIICMIRMKFFIGICWLSKIRYIQKGRGNI